MYIHHFKDQCPELCFSCWSLSDEAQTCTGLPGSTCGFPKMTTDLEPNMVLGYYGSLLVNNGS